MDKKIDSPATQIHSAKKQINIEIWDKNEESDILDMTITIYNGDSGTREFDSLSISPADAVQITGVSIHNLDGFTEWCSDSELLTKNLPVEVRAWATTVLARYLNIEAESLHDVAMLVMRLNTLQKGKADALLRK
jgi:hypothetical protein